MSSVQPCSFLTLHYRLSARDGVDFVNTFDERPATVSLGTGQLSQALEQHLLGLEEGCEKSFDLGPGEAFGPRDPARLQWVRRALLDRLGEPGESYRVGDVVQFPTPEGSNSFAGSVRELAPDGESVLFDFNHPLAGMAVRFEVKVIGIL